VGDKMAKHFTFDDEKEVSFENNDESLYSNDVEEDIGKNFLEDQQQNNTLMDEDTNKIMKKKKKKKFVWKWWHFVLIFFLVLFLAFVIYIFVKSNNDGPVYGNRCENVEVINNDLKSATVIAMKEKYSEIQEITLEVACKQLKVDIEFKDGMGTKEAIRIAEETVQTLDGMVGKTKEEGKTYSGLFGYINNAPQYEVNLFLVSKDSKDFPIYGTKNVQSDSFSYTYASIKDKKSYQAARDTIKEKENKAE